jgi:hypothetical protein
MTESIFNTLEKRFSRKLKHTARFYTVDLHCHSPLSPCFGRKDGESLDDIRATPEQVVIAACQNCLHILAVTDHHRCENAINILKAAEVIRSLGQNLYPVNNLVVLPGMEIAVEENTRTIHILAIFPENMSIIEINRVLDETGVESNPYYRNNLSKVTTKRLIEIIERINDRGGLSILAHVNSSNGYRKEMKDLGWTDELVLRKINEFPINAIEIAKPEDEPHFIKEGKQIACIIGSDAHYIKDIGGKEYITRVKMTKPSFFDLQRALKDPETRIRFQEPSHRGFKKIIGISFEGGFLDGQDIPFTSNLNCLIGSRGAGKSSVIEALRFIFEISIPEKRKKDVDEMLEEVLAGSIITVIFEDHLANKYVLRRSLGDSKTTIMDMSGLERDDINLLISQNLSISLYGWSEIEGIAQDASQQLYLIDSFIYGTGQLKDDEQQILTELNNNARDINNALDTIELESDKIGNLPELITELKTLGEEESTQEKEKVRVETEDELVSNFQSTFKEIFTKLDAVNLERNLKDIIDKIKLVKSQHKILFTNIFDEIVQIIKNSLLEGSLLLQSKANFILKLKELHSDIVIKTKLLKTKHEGVNEAFNKFIDQFDQVEQKQLTRRRERLRQEIRRRNEFLRLKKIAQESLNDYCERRAFLLEQLEDIRSQLFSLRSEHIAKIVTKLPRGKADVDISIEIIEQGNRESFILMLDEKLTGLPRQWKKGQYSLIISQHFTPNEFADVLITRNLGALQNAGFNDEVGNDIIRHLADSPNDILELEMCDCEDLPQIFFNVHGQKKLIENLSPGQRCTALLPIILLEADTPLIIDQPEDNLDNQFIFDLVVNTMRSLKELRQIVVATHNPNIPVSGDAENILVFTPHENKGKIEQIGSIDYAPIINSVKNIMEGGEEAFRLRAQKYNLP